MKKRTFFYLLHFAFYLLFASPVGANPPPIPPPPPQPTPPAAEAQTNTKKPRVIPEPSVFPVGLNVGKRNVNPSVLVRGQEDGTQAINLANWLIPYDAVIAALKLKVTTLTDGQLEVRAPGVVTRIDPKKISTDPELGLVFSIQDLETLLNVKAEFDIDEYALVLEIPALKQSGDSEENTETPIVLDGLPLITAAPINVGAVEQKVNASGTETRSPSYRGELVAVGSIANGSWFVRTEQRNLQDWQTWKIAEAQYLRQTNQADYILGSQPAFWQSQGTDDYWGFTYINRQGYKPRSTFGAGSTDPRQRLQAGQVGRTITGKAEPGTLVRLVQGLGDRVIAEVLVDSSGIYRFENINNDNFSLAGNYRVLLYPQGRLTAQPEIREANFSTVPGQLPKGASALVVSGGLRRESSGTENQGLLGNFSDFRGGVAQRWGVSENLTVGLGGVYDESLRGLAELYYRPANVPLQVAASVLTGDQWKWNADIRYEPSSNFSAAFRSDDLSSNFNVNWQVLRGLSLFASADSRDGTAGGVQVNFSSKNAFTFARVSYDSESRLRWYLLQRLNRLELMQRGNEIGTLSELTYNFADNPFGNTGSSLLLSYETQNQSRSDSLLSLGWRYRSQQQTLDGSYLWEGQLGYGIGSQGSGLIATLSTAILPGMLLRARYQGVSLTSDEASFSIDLVSSLNTQRGISPGDRRSNYFRTQGGLLIQPFLDTNNNGRRDAGEEAYTDYAETMYVVNNNPIKIWQPQVQGDRILVRLAPNTYRLDLDPAGFPPDWQATSDAYAVNVVAGSHTPVLVPFIRSYTLSGVVTDTQGNPVNGARVEAVSKTTQQPVFSVTNTAGVYYIERLQQGIYNLLINGKPAANASITFKADSEPLQELNLQQP